MKQSTGERGEAVVLVTLIGGGTKTVQFQLAIPKAGKEKRNVLWKNFVAGSHFRKFGLGKSEMVSWSLSYSEKKSSKVFRFVGGYGRIPGQASGFSSKKWGPYN